RSFPRLEARPGGGPVPRAPALRGRLRTREERPGGGGSEAPRRREGARPRRPPRSRARRLPLGLAGPLRQGRRHRAPPGLRRRPVPECLRRPPPPVALPPRAARRDQARTRRATGPRLLPPRLPRGRPAGGLARAPGARRREGGRRVPARDPLPPPCRRRTGPRPPHPLGAPRA